jgi:indolepyruvate ferredoxin oxidoreductase beta subunit
MESKNFELILAGVGGQGIIFAGQIIMNAALKQGFKVIGFEEHGMARRGGAVATHIRFGEEVHTPLVPIGSGKLLVAFEPSEALRHLSLMGSDGVAIINSKPVIPVSVSAGKGTYPDIKKIESTLNDVCEKVLLFDASSLACEAGNPISLNIVMLGAMCGSTSFPIKKEVVLEIVEQSSPSYSKDVNVKALDLGYKEFVEKE